MKRIDSKVSFFKLGSKPKAIKATGATMNSILILLCVLFSCVSAQCEYQLVPELRSDRRNVTLADGSIVAVTSSEGTPKANYEVFVYKETGDNPSSLEDNNELSDSVAKAQIDDDGRAITMDGNIYYGGGLRTYWKYFTGASVRHKKTFNDDQKALGLVGNGGDYAARLADGTIFIWGGNIHRHYDQDFSWDGNFLKLPEGKKVASIIYYDLTELVVLSQDGLLYSWRQSLDRDGNWGSSSGAHRINIQQGTSNSRKIVAIDTWQPKGWKYDNDELMLGLKIYFDNGEIEDWSHVRKLSFSSDIALKVLVEEDSDWQNKIPETIKCVFSTPRPEVVW